MRRRLVGTCVLGGALAATAALLPSGAGAVAPAAPPARPIVTGLSAHSGASAGGQPVVITGLGLARVTKVLFGYVRAPELAHLGGGRLLVIAPHTAATGVVDVVLLTPAGASRPVPADRFTYVHARRPTQHVVTAPLPDDAASPRSDEPFDIDCSDGGFCGSSIAYVSGTGYASALDTSAGGHRWSTQEVPLGSRHTVIDGLPSVDCPADGVCVLVGAIAGGFGTRPVAGMLAGGTVSSTPLPTGDGYGLPAGMTSVACRSTSYCAAVGGQTTSGGAAAGLLDVYDGTAWTNVALLPSDGPQAIAALTRIACSTSVCLASGRFADGSPALLFGDDSGWASSAVPVPSGDTDAQLDDVGCTDDGHCYAIGSASTAAGPARPFLVSGSDGAFAAQAIAPPPGFADTKQDLRLDALSCAADGSCTAAGVYRSVFGRGQLFVARISAAGGLSTVEVPVPAGAGAVDLRDVSCGSADECEIVGGYTTGGPDLPFVVRLSDGVWTALTPSPDPLGSANILQTVSCTGTGRCDSVGFRQNTDNSRDSFLLSE